MFAQQYATLPELFGPEVPFKGTTRTIQDGDVVRDVIQWGAKQHWAYIPSNSTPTTVYITINACVYPNPDDTLRMDNKLALWRSSSLPTLTLSLSNSSAISLPDRTKNTYTSDLKYGFANMTIFLNSGTLFIAVEAPPHTLDWSKSESFDYQIGLSTSGPLHSYSRNRFIFLQSSDFSAALLTTGNLTSMEIPNYNIWVNPAMNPANPSISNDTDLFASNIQSALRHSWCAISQTPAKIKLGDADRSMTTRGPGRLPKQQFYVHELKPSTFYDVYLTLQANGTSGGTVWPVQRFRTKDSRRAPCGDYTYSLDSTCQVVYGLEFCDQVAYSVPSNTTKYNPTALAEYYDSLASAYYQNFSNSLQLVNCNASNDAVYSLISNCKQCAQAYKEWICAVTIPRCADLTNPSSVLVYRNSSRNPKIDEDLQPGPYKEVLPCGDLVENVAMTCPAALGFRVPLGKAFDLVYGARNKFNETITCNAP